MILLTGATGKCGSEAARQLLARGAALRVLVRDVAKAGRLTDAGADVVIGDAADPAALDRAMDGCDRALLLLPNSEGQLAMERQFIDRAQATGIGQVVKLSSMEAGPSAASPIPQAHWAAEEYLRASGLAWTMIRPNFFMQNLLANAATIKSMNKFFLPMGGATTGMCDCRDIGAIIARALDGSGHENQSYDITGPELLSFHDVAERFTRVLGRKVEYVDQPMAAYREMLGKFLTNKWHLDAVCGLFGEIAKGSLDYTTDTVQRLLGRQPIALEQFIRDFRAVFEPN